MKVTALLKYSIIMIVFILVLFLMIATYTYLFTSNQILNYICYAIVPIGIFITSFLYAGCIKERGLLRGLEIWAVYFIIVTALKYIIIPDADISIMKHLLMIPVAIVGSVIGVNVKK